MLLFGCSKPVFLYDPEPGKPLNLARELALDPRRDLLFVLEGKRTADPGPMKEVTLRELEAKGYRILPSEQSAKAGLWIDVIAFMDGGRGPGAGSMSKGGGRGSGGMGGGRGGKMGGDGGGSRRGGGSLNAPPDQPSHPSASGLGMVYIVQLVDPKSGELVWYGKMDVDAAIKKQGSDRPQSIQDQVRQFLAPLPSAQTEGVAMPSAK